jgi:hypothetical protein
MYRYPIIRIILDGEGMGTGRDMGKAIPLNTMVIAGLPGGMVSGKPSIMFVFDLPDGRWVFAETSLALFLNAADGFVAYYGDPRT